MSGGGIGSFSSPKQFGIWGCFFSADDLDLALVTMGEGLVKLAIQHRIINLINTFLLILMHIISFDVFFLVGKT